MKCIRNDIAGCEYADVPVCGSDITWRVFAETINDLIIELGQGSLSSEDHRLGAYFVRADELADPAAFAEKVLMYLWNDAFKYDHSRVFNAKYRTLEDLVDGFMNVRFGVFLDTVRFSRPEPEAVPAQNDAPQE